MIGAMRKLLLTLVLVVVLAPILVFSRSRPGPPALPAVIQTEQPAELQAANQSADQLIVQAVGPEAATARQAYAQLQQIGGCPYLPDSPEGPVGLAAAAFDLHGSDRERVRETIALLVQQGCDVNQYSAAGLTPLHGAIIGRSPDLLRILLEQGADPRLRVIPVPGSPLGRSIAHLDAYGVALVLRNKFPDDATVREILDLLRPAA